MKKIWSKWKSTIIIGFLILAAGVFLRLYNLINLPIFADEAIYIRWSQVMRAESTLRFLPLSDGKQPLFMWMVIPFLKIFSDPLFAGRFVSVICGIVTTIGVFVASNILFKSKKINLLASLVYAIMPFSVFFDRLALVDSMLTMFGIWTFIFAVLTLKNRRVDFAIFTGFALGGALLTKSPALFFSLLLSTIWVFFPKKKEETCVLLAKIIKTGGLFIIIYLTGYAMYNILRLGPNFHLLKLRNLDYVYSLKHLFTSPFNPFRAHILSTLDYFLKFGPAAFIVLFLFGLIEGVRNYFKPTLVLLAWGLVPIFVNAEYAKVLTARYILFCLPFLVIISAEALFTKGLAKKIVIAVIAVFAVQSLLQNRLLTTNIQAANLPRSERSGYLEEWTSGYGIREIADYIKAEKMKDIKKQFVIGTEGYFGTLPDGLQIYLNDTLEVVVIGTGLGFQIVPVSLVESKKAGNRTFLVINNTRLLIKNPESQGLSLIASYPKALRKVGSAEYNLYGPQESLLLFELKD